MHNQAKFTHLFHLKHALISNKKLVKRFNKTLQCNIMNKKQI